MKLWATVFAIFWGGMILYLFLPVIQCSGGWGGWEVNCENAVALSALFKLPVLVGICGVSLSLFLYIKMK
jgi:hypothetical protein